MNRLLPLFDLRNQRSRTLLILSMGLGLLAVTHSGMAAESKKEPATHTIKTGSLKGKITLSALVESAEMAPIKLEPKAWSDLEVVEAVPHGSKVRKGDVILRLDKEKIEEKIQADERARVTAVLDLEQSIDELANLEKTTPLQLDAATRSKRIADEDYAYFEDVDREQKQISARFMLRSSEQRLANAQEELDQLQKMYEADDLTEETEEIILKRQKFAVESAKQSLERSRLMTKRMLETTIPREYETLKSAKMNSDLAFALARKSLPRALIKMRESTEKTKRDREKADEKLEELRHDLELFEVRAPMDGLVYYGNCDRGKWTSGSTVAKKLIPGGKVLAREIFMTVVDPENLVLRAVVTEEQLGKLSKGEKGYASPVPFPDEKLEAKIQEMKYIPLPGGGFEALIRVDRNRELPLMPGMNCKVHFGDNGEEDGLIAPSKAVFGKGDRTHVYVQGEDGKPSKTMVRTGDSSGGNVVILDGLKEGDKILLKKP